MTKSIYDEVKKDDDVSLLISKKRSYNDDELNYEFDAEQSHRKWMDMKAEQKKQDLQQLEESKREMEEIEKKLLQNRQLEKEIADGPLSYPWEVEQKRWSLYEINGGGRKLLDDFADSLKFVNKMYTQAFGAAARKVPAHMPRIHSGCHFLTKNVV